MVTTRPGSRPPGTDIRYPAPGPSALVARQASEKAKAHPEVSVWHRILPGTPRSALLDAAAGARLLVVGARGRGGFEEMSLGSVAHAVLQYAPCPVAVVRPG